MTCTPISSTSWPSRAREDGAGLAPCFGPGEEVAGSHLGRLRISPTTLLVLVQVVAQTSFQVQFLTDKECEISKVWWCQSLMMAAANGLIHASAQKPLFTFGAIADVQYADIPDGRSFTGIPRYYRHSIDVLQRAVSAWNKHGGVKFSINFGDIVDGHCPKDKSLWAVQKVLGEFEKFDGPTYHMFGNHCLYNLPRSDLVALMKMPTDSDHAYYDFSPCPEYRFVVLDAYDFSTLGWPRDHPVTAHQM